uniref:CCHC-type domain-containing protein n=1 Tax=Biomphalaria glabrata TaxID=6526 RepID=A0A2C9M5J8_BIOGL
MELRFGDEHMKEVYRVQLKSRQQKPGETLQELMADIERLARLAYPTLTQEILEVLITDAFIDGVRDPELKKAIRLSGKREASDALVYALSFEAAKDASKTTHFSRGLHVQEEDLTDIIRQVVETIDDRRSQQMPRPNRPVVHCWNCNAPGHIQRNCT